MKNNKKIYSDFERDIKTVHWKDILIKDKNPNIETFMKINGNVFVSELIAIIKNLHKKNKKIKDQYKNGGVSLEISVGIHANSNIMIGFSESDFTEILDFCIKFYEKYEMYESCQKILKIKEQIISEKVTIESSIKNTKKDDL